MKLPKLDDLEELNDNKIESPEEKSKTRPKIPATRKDASGEYILELLIPDLDDVNLTEEIDKYFGEYEEED